MPPHLALLKVIRLYLYAHANAWRPDYGETSCMMQVSKQQPRKVILTSALIGFGVQVRSPGYKSIPGLLKSGHAGGSAWAPIIDQGVHTHALTWPAGLHGLGMKVVTWQCKATTWHERARPLLVRSHVPLLGPALACMTCVDAFYSCLWP